MIEKRYDMRGVSASKEDVHNAITYLMPLASATCLRMVFSTLQIDFPFDIDTFRFLLLMLQK